MEKINFRRRSVWHIAKFRNLIPGYPGTFSGTYRNFCGTFSLSTLDALIHRNIHFHLAKFQSSGSVMYRNLRIIFRIKAEFPLKHMELSLIYQVPLKKGGLDEKMQFPVTSCSVSCKVPNHSGTLFQNILELFPT